MLGMMCIVLPPGGHAKWTPAAVRHMGQVVEVNLALRGQLGTRQRMRQLDALTGIGDHLLAAIDVVHNSLTLGNARIFWRFPICTWRTNQFLVCGWLKRSCRATKFYRAAPGRAKPDGLTLLMVLTGAALVAPLIFILMKYTPSFSINLVFFRVAKSRKYPPPF